MNYKKNETKYFISQICFILVLIAISLMYLTVIYSLFDKGMCIKCLNNMLVAIISTAISIFAFIDSRNNKNKKLHIQIGLFFIFLTIFTISNKWGKLGIGPILIFLNTFLINTISEKRYIS